MFADILNEKRLNQLNVLFTSKDATGQDKSSAGGIIIDIINEFRKQSDDYFLKILKDTTVINIFKLNKKKKELEKGFDEVTRFYKWLEEREMIAVHIANQMITTILESLAKEIRTIKERETAILEVLASWSAIILSIIALIVSFISLNLR